MMRVIIIDDEKNARESIINLIDLCCDQLEVVDQAESVKEGVMSITKHKPDLVFLDIQLLDGSGFDLLKQFYEIDFKLIFITAFQEYAIQAFKFSAIDYLLKPINPQEFIAAVNKAEQSIDNDNLKLKLDAFFDNINERNPGKLVLKTAESIHLVNIKEIIRCKSDKGYTEFYLISGKRIVMSRTLKEYEELLVNSGFVRPHQSHLINLDFIESFEKADGGSIRMTDNSLIPVSHRKRESILALFG